MSWQTLESFSRAWFETLQKQARLFTLEAKMAKISFFPCLLFLVFSLLSIVAFLLTSFIFLGIVLYHFTHNLIVSALIPEVLSLLLVAVCFYFFFFFYQQMLFKKTRAYLKSKGKACKHAENMEASQTD